MEWNNLAPKPIVEHAISALKEHGVNALYAENGEEARKLFLSILPEGARVMNMTSMTLSALDLDKEVNESGRHAEDSQRQGTRSQANLRMVPAARGREGSPGVRDRQ